MKRLGEKNRVMEYRGSEKNRGSENSGSEKNRGSDPASPGRWRGERSGDESEVGFTDSGLV